MSSRTRTVVVVHPESLVAEAIATSLSNRPGLLAAGTATTLQDAKELARRADAVAIHVAFPGARDFEADLKNEGVRVVLIGDQPSIDSLASDLSPGPWSGSNGSGRRPLSSREKEILELVARGMVGKQVAHRLGISPKTVEQHKSRIYAKLGVPNQTAAVHMALLQTRGRA